jgi:hypothetical protein
MGRAGREWISSTATGVHAGVAGGEHTMSFSGNTTANLGPSQITNKVDQYVIHLMALAPQVKVIK